jgi:tRNA(adenine34) deaminase
MPWMEWYDGLAKPGWTPAPATIGLIWQILYPIILVTFGFVFVQALRRKLPWSVAVPFAINLGANLIFHADPVRPAEPAAGFCGYSGGVGDDPLDDSGDLAVLPLDRRGPGAVFHLGVAGDGAATEHHLDELGTDMSDLNHEHYMRRAIELAANMPDQPFAAVIVDRSSGQIVAEGWNKSSINPTWYGEIDAINRLSELPVKPDPSRVVLYTTAEPCPMCQGAVLWSGIGAVVYGTSIRFLQSLGWRQIDILAEEVVRRSPAWRCTLVGGVLEQECNALFELASR